MAAAQGSDVGGGGYEPKQKEIPDDIDQNKSIMQNAFIGKMLKEAMDSSSALTEGQRERLLMAFNLACITIMAEQKIGIHLDLVADPFSKLYPVRQKYLGHLEAAVVPKGGITVRTRNSNPSRIECSQLHITAISPDFGGTKKNRKKAKPAPKATPKRVRRVERSQSKMDTASSTNKALSEQVDMLLDTIGFGVDDDGDEDDDEDGFR